MMQFTHSIDETESSPSSAEMELLMTQKAHELFAVCDTEEKGFITKRDMQRLQSELPLNPDQLENVFDSLDDDGNGFLTLEEFTDGFGSFLGLKQGSETEAEMASGTTYTDEVVEDPLEEQHFHQVMDQLGASHLLDGDSTVKSLWCRLKQDDPEMASTFEDFVFRMSSEMRKSKSDFESLEDALRSKTTAHDEEVRKLYEEMETQIKQEKDKILNEERQKERQLREAMEQELFEKERQVQELLSKHGQMEDKLGFLNTVEAETKVEKEKLAKEKEDLEESYMASQRSLSECQAYINQLREQQKSDKRERARDALKLSEGIALERETLVEQLEKLKSVNRKLQDEKDEASIRRVISYESSNASLDQEVEDSSQESSRSSGDKERRGSVLGKYFDTRRISKSTRADSIKEDVIMERGGDHIDFDDDNIEYDDDMYIDNPSPAFIHHTVNSYHLDNHHLDNHHLDNHDYGNHHHGNHQHSNMPIYSTPIVQQHGNNIRVADVGESTFTTAQDSHYVSDPQILCPDSPRSQPVGADAMNDSGIQSALEPLQWQRIFKVVFVGDSGVGKSSFIHRFCSGNFRPSFAATIGVDFQMKTLPIDGQVIGLQLWDTAGQERFRSITKQYFRKADGVIVMYDVTTEATFTNVRNWMDSVKEGVSEDAVLMLLGNKNDLVEDDSLKAVTMKDGSRLADEFGTLFYETSALNGENVPESIDGLARVLKEKEDKQIEKSFKLEDEGPKKKGCCPLNS